MAVETILARAPTAEKTALPADSPPLKSNLPNKRDCIGRMKALYDKQAQYLERWKAIRDYQLPFVGEFDNSGDKTNPGRRRDLAIAQGVAWLSAQVFAAGVMSGLTPPSRQWFKFSFSNSEQNTDVTAMQLLDERQEIVSAVLAKSNFYNSVHSCYLELPFGQAPLAIFPDPKTGVRFVPLTIGTYALGVNGFGQVERFARKYEMTLTQVVECFGEQSLPRAMKNRLKSDSKTNKTYTVNWLVEPNDKRLPGRIDNLNMPYRSIYWMEQSASDEFLYVGGFHEFPVPCGRYLVNGLEPYGKGPGWFCEGDSKALQVMKKDFLVALELHIKPPMQAPQSIIRNGINLIPGSATPVENNNQDFVKPLFQVNVALDHMTQEIVRTEDAIKRAYSADLFLMLDSIDTGQMTAREVMERQQEKLQQLGPVVERLQDEFLNLIIERVYSILDRAGVFPPLPEEVEEALAESEIKIEYVSPLAQAQKMSGLISIEQSIAFVAQMAQMYPEALKTVDPVGTISKYFDMLGTPAKMRRSPEEVAEMIEQEQQAMQEAQEAQEQMAMAQATAPLAQAAKNATEAANDGNPALRDWLGMGGAGAGEI